MTSTAVRAGRILLLSLAVVFAFGSTVIVRFPSDGVTAAEGWLVQTGRLTSADRGHVIERAFSVPANTQQIDIDFTFSPTDRPTEIDLGVRSPRGIRGWSEDRIDHVHIDLASASLGYLPGPIDAGPWALLIGVAYVPDLAHVRYHAEIRTSATLDPPRPTLRTGEGWYAGDLHTHSGHSDGYRRLGDGTRRPVSVADIQAAALREHLDFAAITDHNTISHWVDVDRAQLGDPRLLLLHGTEVTTYQGHFNALGGRRLSDFQLGIERPMARVLRDAAADGAFVSINHPWLADDEWCMGCRWTPTDDRTIDGAQGIEIVNGPLSEGSLPGWRMWAGLLNAGHRLVAVGGSDTHDPTTGDRPIGRPATVVHAAALSERAIVAGLQRGLVYIRTEGVDGPSLDVTAAGALSTAAMGESIRAGRIELRASIGGAQGQECVWMKRGDAIRVDRIRSAAAVLTLATDAAPGDWFSVVVRNARSATALSNAIYVDP